MRGSYRFSLWSTRRSVKSSCIAVFLNSNLGRHVIQYHRNMNETADNSSLTSSKSGTSSESSIEDGNGSKTASPLLRSSSIETPKLTPFKLKRSYGINPRVPVVNLTSQNRTLIAYACSHASALYDYSSRDMYLLQGHKNYVSTISTDTEGKWLLTADAGKDSVVIIWDTETRIPIRTLFNPHGSEELLAAKLSPNAKYVATVSNELQITLNFWLWSYGRDEPDATTVLTGLGNDRVKEIVFNSDLPNQFLLGLENHVVFVTWENESLNWTCAKINGNIERFGALNVSSYVTKTRQALTGTNNGYLLVWSDITYGECFSIKQKVSNVKKHVKSLRLQSCAVTAIACDRENIVVIGNVLGHIKFYDNHLKLLFCCEKFGLDRISSISFHLNSNRKAPAPVFSKMLETTPLYENNSVLVAASASTVENIEDSDDSSEDDKIYDEGFDDQNIGTLESPVPRKSKYLIERRNKFINLTSNVTISMDLAPRIELDEDRAAIDESKINRDPDKTLLDYTLQQAPFVIDDFIVFTSTSRIARIEISSLKCHHILHQSEAAVTAVATHPDRVLIATGNMAGRICLYEYNNHHLLVSKQAPELPCLEELIAGDVTGSITGYITCPRSHKSLVGVTALKFSPNGRELVCGMQSGALWILHPDTLDLEDEIPFKHSSGSILDVVFAEKSDYMAYRDDGMASGAYRYTEPDTINDTSGAWQFLGKYHSHSLPIREILFGPPSSGGSAPRLFSLSEDCNFVEYDLENSGPYPEPGLKILKIIRIEQSAVPLCMAWYPKFEVERFFVFSNTEYKFKLLNDCTKLIQGTYLGPTFGAPVNKITFLPMRNMHNQAYMVFSTDTEIGLQLLPFDGNPYMIVGIVGHPRMITGMSLSHCGEYLFTLGYNDPCVLMWNINPRAVDVMAKLGGTSLSPFYCLIDGGQHGWLLNEMQDLFYYAQILHQGENTTANRQVSDKVSVTQLPNLMRAVGYYPSAHELEELMTEVVSNNYAKTGQLVEEITFEEFVKLYVNHRPVFGVSMHQVKKAFAAFSKPALENDPAIDRELFLEILTNQGDRMSIKQAHDALSLLIPAEEELEENSADINFSFLPADISYKDFAVGILGIEPVEETNISTSPDKDTP